MANDISCDELKKNLEKGACILIDVRTEEEYSEGYIKDCVWIALDTFPTKLLQNSPDKDKAYVLYCASGARSELAKEFMIKNGYTNVKNFGGICDWTGEICR